MVGPYCTDCADGDRLPGRSNIYSDDFGHEGPELATEWARNYDRTDSK